jgi:hypothetical protein
MLDPQIPEPVRPILEQYLSLIEKQIPDLIRAFYIVGSIALHGYNQHFSDIDFVAVLNHHASLAGLESLRSTHSMIESRFPKSKLSGSYLQWNDLGRFEDEVQPHPYYQDGRFHTAGYFEINSVTWWILKHHGIAIRGDAPEKLPFTVDWDLLLAKMKENLNTYWLGWTKRPRAYLIMLTDWGIQWTVLGVLRQHYTFRERSITTKLEAAKYALTCLPQQWHPLIQEAILIREGNNRRRYVSRITRMIETVRFLKYVIQICN